MTDHNIIHQLVSPSPVSVEEFTTIETFNLGERLFIMPLPEKIGPRDLFDFGTRKRVQVDLDYFTESVIHILQRAGQLFLMPRDVQKAKIRILGPVKF